MLDRAAPGGVLGGAVVGVGGVAVVALSAPEFVAVTAVPILVGGLLAVIDQRTTRIATRHVAVLAVLTLVASALGIALVRGSWASVLLGAGIWAVPLFVLALFAGFGGGDFKYALCLGAVTGWVSLSAAVTGLLLGVLVAALAGVVVARGSGQHGRRSRSGCRCSWAPSRRSPCRACSPDPCPVGRHSTVA